MKRPFSFTKSHRLKNPLTISNLFNSGETTFVFPVKMVFSYISAEHRPSTFQAAVSVPKKIFKRAIDRNRLKRHLREAIRLNQDSIPKRENEILRFILIYSTKEVLSGQQIHKAVRSLFDKLYDNGNTR